MNNELPNIGDGATMSVGSDCYPYTVVRVTAKTVTIQRDDYEPAPGYDYYSNQVHTFTPNKGGSLEVVRMTKRGWRVNGMPVTFGHRRAYSNPSF